MEHLRNLSIDELLSFVEVLGEPPYRARQLASWLYTKNTFDFSSMTDLPLSLREALSSRSMINSLQLVEAEVSTLDGTKKFLLKLRDGEFIESVLMRHDDRITLCISTQVGCPLDCVFCLTGNGGFRRNLTCGEMIDQICNLRADCLGESEKVNVVFMGMGEPLLNYGELVKAIAILNHPLGLNTGSRRITVSTAGIPDRIKSLADTGLKCSLAISLNASNDAKRLKLMPAAGRHRIADVLAAARYFHKKTRRRVTVEYVLISGINTAKKDAVQLGKLVHKGPFKVNLIPCNSGMGFSKTGEEEINAFIKHLLPLAPAVTVRRSKGEDIKAACGQLWTHSLSKEKPAKGFHGSLGEEKAGKESFRRKKRN